MKTYKYEFSHQSNLIQIGNLIDDMWQVHLHLLQLQRRYYRILWGLHFPEAYPETYYEVETHHKTALECVAESNDPRRCYPYGFRVSTFL